MNKKRTAIKHWGALTFGGYGANTRIVYQFATHLSHSKPLTGNVDDDTDEAESSREESAIQGDDLILAPYLATGKLCSDCSVNNLEESLILQ